MGLFNKPRKPLQIQHDVLGPLLYHSSRDDRYYEGTGLFIVDERGATRSISFVMYANDQGPSAAQQELYKKLQTGFYTYIQKMIPMLEQEFSLWGKNITIKDFNNEFSVVLLSMQQENEPPIKWQVILDTIHDTNHQIIIDFADNEPVDILFDV